MANVIDLTGQRFGRLVVIQFMGMNSGHNARWECICDCGNIKTYRSGDLRKKKGSPTRSCGCLKRDKARKGFGESAFNKLYRRYKTDAERKNRPFSLTKEHVKEITSSPCHYCGVEPYTKIVAGETNYGHYIYNGIDRIDSSRGYEINNVVPCCIRCNRAKHTMTYQEFNSLIQNIYMHWISQS